MDLVFKALADEGRRRLLDALRERNGQTLGELVACLDMSRQAASKHLALLERAQLVTPLWEGREKRLYLNPVPIALLARRWISRFEEQRVEAIAGLKIRLEQSDDERGEPRPRQPNRRAR